MTVPPLMIDYGAERNLLVSVKGHSYERDAFANMLDKITAGQPGLTWTAVEQPATDALIEAEALGRFDALLFYDMPGMQFGDDPPLALIEPSPAWKMGFERLLETGKPLIFLHHAIAGWPSYPRYAQVIGGEYLFKPRTSGGHFTPDSGYRHDVVHHVTPIREHPITEGLDGGFHLEDEAYLFDVLEDDVTGLMVSDHAFVPGNFYSTDRAVHGRINSNEGWDRPQGSRLFAWVRREGASPIVYIQGGHGPAAYTNAGYQRLLANAIGWAMREAAAGGSGQAEKQ